MKILILAFSAIILSACSFAKIYEEKIEDINKRLKYYNEKSEEITNGKIIFKHTNESGLYCEANQDIEKKEYAFYLKDDYIISFCKLKFLILIFKLVDMFPFKFELKNALIDYYSNGMIENFKNSSIPAVQNQLFSFYLMFLSYENRTAVFDYVDSVNKKFYHIDVPKEFDEYLELLPKVLYTVTEFDETEFKLLEIQGHTMIPEYQFEDVLSHVVAYIKNHYEKHAVIKFFFYKFYFNRKLI